MVYVRRLAGNLSPSLPGSGHLPSFACRNVAIGPGNGFQVRDAQQPHHLRVNSFGQKLSGGKIQTNFALRVTLRGKLMHESQLFKTAEAESTYLV